MKTVNIKINENLGSSINALMVKLEKGYRLSFSEKIHGEYIHIITTSNIKNFGSFIARFITRNHKPDDVEIYDNVVILNHDFEVVETVDVLYKNKNKNKKIYTFIPPLVEVCGIKYVEVELQKLIDDYGYLRQGLVFTPTMPNYTRNDDVNNLLYACKQPADYDRKLSALFTNTYSRIAKFKEFGADVYVDTRTSNYKIFVIVRITPPNDLKSKHMMVRKLTGNNATFIERLVSKLTKI